MACAAGLAVCNVVFDDVFLREVKRNGALLRAKLEELKEQLPERIQGVRGMGLMLGMVLKEPGAEIVRTAIEKGLLFNCTAEKVLRFLPPLTVTGDEIEEAIGIVKESLEECSQE